MPPVRRLTVLYDPGCSLCAWVRDWLARQRQLVPLDLVPVGSPEARQRFPRLDHAAAGREITVVGDSGQVYQAEAAWVACLWALERYRPMAHRLASRPALARAAVLTAAKYRAREAATRSEGWQYDPRRGWSCQDAAPQAACADGCGAAPFPAPD